ncbi:MAG TPA: (2Fe-2S)-binding protein [Polyangiales bacterium]|nr:(2Fe-2S)-binding protein [Polyangiales bacterium]
MIVCHCFRVSDREIRSCVREGACSVSAVGHACDAGTGCGGCRPEIASIVEGEQLVTRPAYKPMLPVLQTA